MVVTLAAMLGQIGLAGRRIRQRVRLARVRRPARRSVATPPSCRRAESGARRHPVRPDRGHAAAAGASPSTSTASGSSTPDIRLVYWCGGNPFHHHQDLARLRRALATPDTIVVHDPFWTPMARHADVVLPATVTLERNDIGGSPNDPCLFAMRRVIEPYAEARTTTRSSLTSPRRSGSEAASPRGGTRWRGSVTSTRAGARRSPHRGGPTCPGFDEFWAAGSLRGAGRPTPDLVLLNAFRDDPEGARLATPSGRIEIFSATIDGFGYKDCPGHPSWLEPTEWLGAPLADRYPLHLVANNPTTRLHSQLDVGAFSQASKVQGREPIRMHPARRRAPRHPGRRRRPSLQRARELPGRRRRHRRRASPRGPARDGSVVRPARPRGPRRDVPSTGIRTCSRSTGAPRSWRRAAPASTRSSRSSGGPAPCPRSAPTTRRPWSTGPRM